MHLVDWTQSSKGDLSVHHEISSTGLRALTDTYLFTTKLVDRTQSSGAVRKVEVPVLLLQMLLYVHSNRKAY